MRFDCAQMENGFLRKRLQQFEERLDSELTSRKELEQQVRGSSQSASQRRQRVGGFLPPRLKVGRENEATDPPRLSTSTVNTNAGHCGIWKAFSPPVGVLLWERIAV